MLNLMMPLLIVVTYICVLCLFGDGVTSQLELINYSIKQTSWNVFPLETQKHLIIMLINSQRPVYIQGFMNTKCTREVLAKVDFHNLIYFEQGIYLTFF